MSIIIIVVIIIIIIIVVVVEESKSVGALIQQELFYFGVYVCHRRLVVVCWIHLHMLIVYHRSSC